MNLISRIKKSDYNTNYYLFLIIAFCVTLRILTPQIIGVGGDDAVESWGMARRLFFNADYYLIHRTARFGTIIPVYLTQLLFGTHPLVYYAAPAIASVIQIVFFYKIARRVRGESFAFISSVALLSFPQMIRDVSHPRVSVFSTMFFLISLYYALKFYMDCSPETSDSRIHRKDLLISGINVFFMYMSKEDSVYFLPVLMLIVFMSRKRFSDIVLFGIVPFSLFISETVAYNLFTEFSKGRLSLLNSNHFDFVAPVSSWLSLFDRFRGEHLRPYFRYPLFISFIGGIYILAKRRYSEDSRINPAVFITLCLFIYIFFLTFLVKSLHPVIPFNTFRTRYMNIIIPPMILIITYILYDLCALLKSFEFMTGLIKKIPSFFSDYIKTFTSVFLVLYTIITVSVFFDVYKKEIYKKRSENYFQLYPFKLVYNCYSIINNQFNSGKPFITHGAETPFNDRFAEVLKTVDDGVRSGMTLEEACKIYKITTDQYYTYKANEGIVIFFEADAIPTRIYLNPDPAVSGLSYFDVKIKEKYYRFYYNSYLTDRDKIIKEWKNGLTVYPEIIFSPFEVIFTDLRYFDNVKLIPVPLSNIELNRNRKAKNKKY